MLSIQEALQQMRQGSSPVLNLLRLRQRVHYSPLEPRGDGFFGFRLQEFRENLPRIRHPKSSKVLWALGAAMALISLLFAAHWLRVPRSETQAIIGSNFDHPIQQLVRLAQADFDCLSARQSKSFQEAVAEYRRRYHMPPPPHFEEWYRFALEHDTRMIDEYDVIYHSLLPFWSLEPKVIRERTREALGYENALMGVSIRDGVVRTIGRGQDEYQEPATVEMITPFARWLPDMDLAFNRNDESRVLVPHEDLERMLSVARKATQSVRPAADMSSNRFTKAPDLTDGLSYKEVHETRFNQLDHQQTWTHSRMSCGLNTPARNLDDNTPDAKSLFQLGDLGFVYNTTAFSDVCLSPSLRHSIGLFNHPNVYAVSHELVPIFSPSKISTFQDILYPSPYYYAEKTLYEETGAVQWEDKFPKLYWRGTTSGGYSQRGSWRTLLRQSVVAKLQSFGVLKVLERESASSVSSNTTGRPSWVTKEVPGSEFSDKLDVKFTEIKQCDPVDCMQMYELFGHHNRDPQEEAWKHRYLLDMDGNALSGRFYALLKSKSLPLKLAYFREWHSERIFPWTHYVPVSAETDEYAEILRYFEEEEEGRLISANLSSNGQAWAQHVVRKEDMQVWMFRMLLEYGRLVDDNRQRLGYVGP